MLHDDDDGDRKDDSDGRNDVNDCRNDDNEKDLLPRKTFTTIAVMSWNKPTLQIDTPSFALDMIIPRKESHCKNICIVIPHDTRSPREIRFFTSIEEMISAEMEDNPNMM